RTITAGGPDNHFAFRDTWRHRQRLLILRISDASFPNRLPRFGVERYQSSVVDRHIDLVVVERETAIHDATAHSGAGRLPVDFRIPAPFLLAGSRIKGEHDAPVGDAENRVVPHERRGFLVSSAFAHFVKPGKPETFHVARVDLLEWT